MNTTSFIRLAAPILALTALASCSSGVHNFAGNLGPEGRAVIASGGNVRLCSLDGQKPVKNGACFPMSFKGNTTLQVTPGRHRVGVSYYWQPASLMFADALQNASVNQFSGPTVRPGTQVMRGFVSTTTPILEINAKAGHVYTLMEERTGKRWRVYVKDSHGGQSKTDRSHAVEGAMRMDTQVF
ncbi:hypothetical protein [Prosthecobacter sp.]|uniref:hypothetical protein n=1 Tax=Prosthecobacter sp. TaxID=1965333 RepID=UPI003783EACC